MITLAGSAVGAAWPIFLAAIPLGLGALIYLFRAKGTAQPQVTSTLFLLSRMPQYTPNRRRFVPPVQFWLELALVTALALAASGIMTAETGDRVAIVVDTSKSMGARLGADETRLEAAIRIAAADISQAPSETTFTVFSAGRTLTPQSTQDGTAATTRAAGAVALVKALQPAYDVDTLGTAISDVLARGEYDSVWLYTDRTVEGVSHSERLRVTTIPFDPDGVRNVWISTLGVRGAKGESIEVGISRVGGETIEVTITATCIERGSGESFTLPSVTQRLPSRGTSRVQLREVSKDWSYCQVSLQGTGMDLLEGDDTAWVVHSTEKGEIGVISSLSTQELGLDRVPYGTAVTLDSEAAQTERELRGVIYHRVTPKARPEGAALVVYPNTGAKLWGASVGVDVAKGMSGTVEITRWEDSHPILQYVRPGLLALPAARVLECPIGAEPIVHSISGPIVCAGEDQGQRYVIVGFEIFPFDGLQTPTLSIFTLNTLQWLLRDRALSGAEFITPGVVRLPGIDSEHPPKVRMVSPRGEDLVVNGARSVEITEPGVLSILDSTSGRERLLAVNAISDQESDLSLQTPVEISAGALEREGSSLRERSPGRESTLAAAVTRETTHYDSVLAWCALLVLVMDLVRRIVGHVGWRERS
jgi:hypothetical protein